MNKKLLKITSLLMIIMLLVSISLPVFAKEDTTGSEMTEIKTDYSGKTSTLSNKAEDIGQSILGVVQVVAGITAVVLLIVLAIKYMTAAPEGKAEIKKTAVIYIVGAAIMFGTSAILGAIKGFIQ